MSEVDRLPPMLPDGQHNRVAVRNIVLNTLKLR